MSLVSSVIGAAERVLLPDVVIRAAIQRLCARTATRLAAGSAESDARFAREAARVVAEHTDAANAQHYEVLAERSCTGDRFIRRHCQSASDAAVAGAFRFGLFGSRQVQADGKRRWNPQPS
jgi:hypothetical protein